MNQRHPQNPNLTLHTEPYYRGLPVQINFAPLILDYLDKIYETIQYALSAHPRTFAARVDLRIPARIGMVESRVISRFTDSLKAQIHADQSRAVALTKRRHFTRLRFIWVKEQADAMFCHYHVLILLNNDAYNCLGYYWRNDGNMASRIKKAWASALSMNVDEIGGLIHFPENGIYRVNVNSESFQKDLEELFFRVSYFAKVSTKNYGDNTNKFGCSR